MDGLDRRVGTVDCSPEYLGDVLGVPAGYRIVGAFFDEDRDVVRLLVEGAGFEVVPEAGCPPKVRLVLTGDPASRVAGRFEPA